MLVGVTGTDGKTTTTSLIYNIMRTAGIQAGMISTVNAVVGEQVLDTGFHVTTPEAPDVQRYLDMMRSAGITHVVLEVTSHGLAQERVAACDFDIGVVTNITHEHLDFHGNYENYRAAKARLFQYLAHKTPKKAPISSLAVLNYDDQSYEYLKNQVQVPVMSYGLASPADLTSREHRFIPQRDELHRRREIARRRFAQGKGGFQAGWSVQCVELPGCDRGNGIWIGNRAISCRERDLRSARNPRADGAH